MALTTRLEPDSCPCCGHILDAASNLDYHTPKVGDLTVCINCQSVCDWDENMRLRLLSAAQINALPPNVLAQVAHIAITIRRELPRFRRARN
jgi:hypothetical protein